VDIWKAACFVVSYKSSGADLDKAYLELCDYHDFPDGTSNPPLLVVCDFAQIFIHTNFNNSPHRIIQLTMEDLRTDQGQSTLRALFFCPDYFRQPVPQPALAPAVEQAIDRFTRIVAMLTQAEHDRTTASGWIVAQLNRESIAYKKVGEDVWRIPTGSGMFKQRIGKSAVQHHGAVWARAGWIELKRGEASAVQSVADSVSLRCICVPDKVLEQWPILQGGAGGER
jgi:hypothetical protein